MAFQQQKIAIIGGNDAGLAAAGRIKRQQPDWEVVVYEQSAHTGYASCGLPFLIAGRVDAAPLAGADTDTILKRRGFHVHLRHQVHDIDRIKRQLSVTDLESGTTTTTPFHKLILCTGATPVSIDAVPASATNAFTLRSYDDAERLMSHLRDHTVQRAVVVGAGFLGLECAAALSHRGITVRVVEQASSLFPGYPSEISTRLHEYLSDQGLELILNATVTGCDESNGHIRQLTLSNTSSPLPADLVIVAAGIRPHVELARSAGLPLSPHTGAIQVDDRQQSKRMNVYAAGDCCESRHRVSGKPVWAPYAGVAAKQGWVAGDRVAGGRLSFPGVLGTSLVRLFDLEAGSTGLTMKEAEAAGFCPRLTAITHDSRSAYLQENRNTHVALVVDDKTQQILGAFMAGEDGVGRRLNALATAIAARFTTQQLAFTDLAYIPESSPVWDPIAMAARVGMK
jgi:NADPH-dependent 2,4-dienoyl-CoA reductase/sulfur reductase-like enzyme